MSKVSRQCLNVCKASNMQAHHFTGGATGRSTERPVLSEEEIERNVQGIKRILEQLISSGNGAGPAPQILNNLVHAEMHHECACTYAGLLSSSFTMLARNSAWRVQRHAWVKPCTRLSHFILTPDEGLNATSFAQDWFQGVGLLAFLRDVGKYARVGTMLSRDAVKSRMELDNEGISYTE